MFNRDRFNIFLASDDFDTACAYLQSHEAELTKNPIIDSSTRTTVLHDLARSVELDKALDGKSKSAKALLNLAMTHTTLTTKEKPTMGTPFHIAIELDHRAIATRIFSHVKTNWNTWNIRSYLLIGDKNKRLPLHHAVINCNHELAKDLVEHDDHVIRPMFFSCDKEGFFPIALAFNRYRLNPNELSLSMINQLYFSVPKGSHRTKIAETNVAFGWGVTSKALWQSALRFCAKRDEKNKITGMDLNLIDFINQAVKDGITVMGMYVTNELMFEYSKSYTGTPGPMLREAFGKLAGGLPGRTLGQATENTTLSRYKEFMQRAQLSEGDYWLREMENDPQVPGALSAKSPERDYIISFNNKLYYVPQINRNNCTPGRSCHEIKFDALTEKEKQYYNNLKNSISGNNQTDVKASSANLKYIIALIPLTQPQQNNSRKIDMPSFTRRGVGRTFFSDYVPLEEEDDSKKQTKARRKNG